MFRPHLDHQRGKSHVWTKHFGWKACKPPFIGYAWVRNAHVEWYRHRGFDFTLRLGSSVNISAGCHW